VTCEVRVGVCVGVGGCALLQVPQCWHLVSERSPKEEGVVVEGVGVGEVMLGGLLRVRA
jgi:hypothetical protein